MTTRKWLAAFATLLIGNTAVAAAPVRRIRLNVIGNCPDVVELRVELARLVPDLVAKPNLTDVPTMSVVDIGRDYLVSFGANKVDIDDAAKNCEERARVAAVFVATLVAPPKFAVHHAPVAQVPPAPETTPAKTHTWDPDAATIPPETLPATAPVAIVPPPSSVAKRVQLDLPRPRATRWYKDLAGGIMGSVGITSLGVGIGLYAHAKYRFDNADNSYFDYLNARNVGGEATASVVLLTVGSVLIVGSLIRYAVVAARLKHLNAGATEPAQIGWTF